MRAGFAYLLMVLVSSFLAASPAFAASAKTPQPAKTTVVQTSSAMEQRGASQQYDQPEDTDVLTAAYNQNNVYGPLMFSLAHDFDMLVDPVFDTPLPKGRDNARIQPFYQLILFPFHVFW